YFQTDGAEKLMNLTSIDGSPVKNVDDLVALQNRDFVEALKKGFTCIKTSVAYFRSLYFEDVTKEKAEACFQMILRSRDKQLPFEAVKPLSDYMMHRMLDLALKYDKPVQIHTGLQAGDGNIIQNSNPALLANLFLKYRNVKFVLFHGGYPYGGEFGSLAKNFRNVYIDLCWVYIISPSYSERYLHEWLETVPANKIMAFGGDYENVENIYGHLLFARQILGNVLVQKVRDGYFTEREAIRVAQMVLHDNAVQLFHLQHI
ncbi:MAG: amidohydrolase, partial [Marinilabiliales bacterium]|nr:amidohydrolase [Marinilabiliales bacterium]